MEQLIFLAIVYGLYILFNALARKKQKQAPPQKRRVPPQGAPPPADVEEIPDILKKMLGLDEPQYVPPPQPVKPAAPKVEPAPPEPIESEPPLQEVKPAPIIRSKKTPEPRRSRIGKRLMTKGELRKAIVLREVLGAPVSMRKREFPIAR